MRLSLCILATLPSRLQLHLPLHTLTTVFLSNPVALTVVGLKGYWLASCPVSHQRRKKWVQSESPS